MTIFALALKGQHLRTDSDGVNHFTRPGNRITPTSADDRSWLFAEKFSFGATPELVAEIDAVGPDAWLETQLAWRDIAEPARLTDTFATFQTPGLVGVDRAMSDIRYQMPQEQQLTTLLRAVWSPRHLYEVLVEFWNDHFNVAFLNAELDMTIKEFEDTVSRQHATGRFADLLFASATSLAMLVYLNQDESVWPEPNENYARELMELHTLGVDGGYTEDDIVQAARALTGWSRSSLRDDDHYWGFVFNEDDHYTAGPIQVLGLTLPQMRGPQSIQHGFDLLDHLAAHPSTARHLARKLAIRFVSDDPSEGLVTAMAGTWAATDGDIASVIRTMAAHPEFLASRGRKVKRPFSALASMLRTLGPGLTYDIAGGAESPAGAALTRAMENLGQRPFYWNSPDGYPDRSAYWAATSGLLARWNTALSLSRDRINGVALQTDVLRQLVDSPTINGITFNLSMRVVGRGPDPVEQQAMLGLTDLPPGSSSADLDDDTFRAMVAMALSTPSSQRR